MRIIHYISSLDRAAGGTAAYMQLLAKELGKLVELHIITFNTKDPLPLENCEIHEVTYFSKRKLMKKECEELLNKLHPDIVHLNYSWMPGCSYMNSVAKKLGYPTVLTPHGMLEPWILNRHYWTKKLPALLLYEKKVIKQANIIHSTAESEKENLMRLGYNKNIHVIANGIDIDRIDIKKDWKLHKKILFLSRVHVKKGLNYLIEAVSVLKEEMNGYEVIIAGEGDDNYIEELKTLARNKGVETIVNFIGSIYGDKKWHLYQDADIFILPTHSENFGIVVAESLACGTPVITTDGTPWNELVSYKCGWYTHVGTEATIEALRAAIHTTDQEREQMGRNGRKLVEEKYSVKIIAEEMVKMYERIINQ